MLILTLCFHTPDGELHSTWPGKAETMEELQPIARGAVHLIRREGGRKPTLLVTDDLTGRCVARWRVK